MSHPTQPPDFLGQPSEDEIRDYAYQLYQQGSREPGHDIENWFEALACLKANIAVDQARGRLHHLLLDPIYGGSSLPETKASVLVSSQFFAADPDVR